MYQPEYCSECKYAKIETEETGLIIYCINPAFKKKPGWNYFTTVRKITSHACKKAEPKEKKEAN